MGKEKQLPMTNEEIRKEYLEAKDRKAQIAILADENLCSVSKIRSVLESEGVEIPHRKYTPRKKPEPFKLETEHTATLSLDDNEKTLLEGLLQIAAEATKEQITEKVGELGGLKRALQDIGKLAMKFEIEIDLKVKEGDENEAD